MGRHTRGQCVSALRPATRALSLAFAALLALGTVPSTDVGSRLQAIVESVPEGTRPEDLAPWAKRVASLGEEAVPEILHRLRAGWTSEGGSTGELLAQSLELLDPRPIVSRLHDMFPPESEVLAADAETALRILRRIGRDRDLGWAVDLALRPGHPARLEEAETLLLEETVSGILARDARAIEEVARIARRQDRPALLPLSRALVAQGSLPALDALVSLVEHGVGDLTVVPLVAGLGDRKPWLVTEQHRSVIRQGLWSDDFQPLREAIQAAARLDDEDALPRLLELANERKDVLGQVVHQALGRLTGQPFPAVPGRWQVWYHEEEQWWSVEWPRLLNGLESRQVRQVLAALDRLEGRTFYRHAIARRVARLLQHQEQDIRKRACQVLSRLRSAEGARPLVLALGDLDPDVVVAASGALEALTGLALGSEQKVWSEALH